MITSRARTKDDPPLRVLFLCTHNAARSQIAEALLKARRNTGLIAASAGTEPATAVHPLVMEELSRRGMEMGEARPKTIESVMDQHWDLVITVCERARESCPALPGRPVTAHWGIPDPSEVEGDEATRRRAVVDTILMLGRRVDLLLALPFEKLQALALRDEVQRIGSDPEHINEVKP